MGAMWDWGLSCSVVELSSEVPLENTDFLFPSKELLYWGWDFVPVLFLCAGICMV